MLSVGATFTVASRLSMSVQVNVVVNRTADDSSAKNAGKGPYKPEIFSGFLFAITNVKVDPTTAVVLFMFSSSFGS